MKTTSLLILVLFFWSCTPETKSIQLFEEGLEYSDPEAWRVVDGVLELHQQSAYEPVNRSPFNIALYKGNQYQSFTLEAELKQTGREYNHRDMCLFFNVEDASNYYYVHLAPEPDQNANNIFIVDNAPRLALSEIPSTGTKWDAGWHHVKVVRDGDSGLIQVYFDDMDNPIMEAQDLTHSTGYVGFGSFDDTGMVRNVKITGKSFPAGGDVF